MQAHLKDQSSFSNDAVLTTDYQGDYITRGVAFQVKKRITLTTGQTLYLEVDISKHTGVVYSLPLEMSTAGGSVFVDTYNADSSTGGTVLQTPMNLNGKSSNVAKTTVKTGVSVSGTAINVREYTVGTLSTNQSSGGGTGQAEVPKILDNTKPLYIKLVNQESATVVFSFGFVWFELPAWS